jgi:hypothetical protein
MTVKRWSILRDIAGAVEKARFCHRVALTGKLNYRESTDDRQWYRDRCKDHMAVARKYQKQLKGL